MLKHSILMNMFVDSLQINRLSISTIKTPEINTDKMILNALRKGKGARLSEKGN